jgi:hypothetical protein
MSNPQNPKSASLVAALAGLVVAAGAGFFVLMGSTDSPSAEVSRSSPAPKQAAVGVPAVAPSVEPVPPVASEQPRARPESGTANRLARDLEREQIWSSLGREHNLKPAVPGSAAPSRSAAELLPTLDPEYVRSAIREQLVPVAEDCYNTVLTEHDPKAAGTVVLNFTIVGSDEIGGVVEESEVGEDSTLDSEFLRECLRESMMTVTFEPPPDGGRVEVTYPITFSPD